MLCLILGNFRSLYTLKYYYLCRFLISDFVDVRVIDFDSSFELIDRSVPLSKAISLISRGKPVVVTDNGSYFGVVDLSSLIRFSGDAEKTRVESVSVRAPVVSKNSSVKDVIELFLESRAKFLPVIEEDRVVGVVGREKVLDFLKGLEVVSGKKVSEFMTFSPVTILENKTVAEARVLMHSKKVSRLLVVDARNRLQGLISDYDIATRVSSFQRKPFRESKFVQGVEKIDVGKVLVKDIMSENVVTVSEKASLKEAIQKMIDENVFSLVIEENGFPKGIISFKDVLEACVELKPNKVLVYGLRHEERGLRESILEECSAFVEKLDKRYLIDYLALHIKSYREGNRMRYEVRARISVSGRIYSAREPDKKEHSESWNPHLAVKEVLCELERVLEKVPSLRKH